MNTQKYVIASIGAFVWLMLYGFVMYNYVVADYMASVTPDGLARVPQDMIAITVGALIQAFALGLIYTKNHEGKGAGEGVRFGLMIAVFVAGMYTLMYGVMNYDLQGTLVGTAVDGLMYVGAGVVLSLLYKK